MEGVVTERDILRAIKEHTELRAVLVHQRERGGLAPVRLKGTNVDDQRMRSGNERIGFAGRATAVRSLVCGRPVSCITVGDGTFLQNAWGWIYAPTA